MTANLAPRLCADMHEAWREGRVEDAIAIQDTLLPLHDAMFCEPSPGPVKYGASLLGFSARSAGCPSPLSAKRRSPRARRHVRLGLIS